MIYFNYYLNFAIGITNIICLQNYLHLFQLRDYNTIRYLSYFNFKYWIFEVFSLSIFVAQILIFNLFFTFFSNLIILLFLPFIYCKIAANNKTPIVVTNRLKNIYIIASIIEILPVFFLNYAILSIILMIFAPFFANFLNFYNKIKNNKFIKTAQNKIKNSNTKVIAITGSNGKQQLKIFCFLC